MPPPVRPRLMTKLENSERGFYAAMLSQADPTDQGRVVGKDAVAFFKRSGLPVESLRKIWLIASSDNKVLNREEFYVALRLVAYGQNGIEVSPESIMKNLKVPLPKMQSQITKAPEVSKQAVQNNNLENIPQGSQPNRAASFELKGNFDLLDNIELAAPINPMGAPQGFSAGNTNTNPITKTQAAAWDFSFPTEPQPVLGDITNTVKQQMPDHQVATNFNGFSNFEQKGGNSPVNVVTMTRETVVQSNTAYSPEPVSNGLYPTLDTQYHLNPIEDPQHFSVDQFTDITPTLVSGYELIFEKYQLDGKGLITSEESTGIFQASGLPNDILYRIWLFCDRGDQGCLDKGEFILATHLITLVKRGVELPEKLPAKYDHFLKEYKRKTPGKDYLIEKARRAYESNHGGVSQQVYTVENNLYASQSLSQKQDSVDGQGEAHNFHRDLQSYQNTLKELLEQNYYIQTEILRLDSQRGDPRDAIRFIQDQISEERSRQQTLQRSLEDRQQGRDSSHAYQGPTSSYSTTNHAAETHHPASHEQANGIREARRRAAHHRQPRQQRSKQQAAAALSAGSRCSECRVWSRGRTTNRNRS